MERSEKEDYPEEERETTPFEDIEAKLKEEETKREEERLAKKEKVTVSYY